MEQEQAERFVVAAEHDYEMAVGWYCAMVEGKAERPEDIVQPRADVLAAQQVLDLARSAQWRARQAQEERERAEEERLRKELPPRGHNGWCDMCGAPAGVMAWGDVDLCPACHVREVRAAAKEGEGRSNDLG